MNDSEMLADIARVAPISAAQADEMRDRVTAVAGSDEFREFHAHLSQECFAFCYLHGVVKHDPIAAYQAMLVGLLDIASLLQMMCRRLDDRPMTDAPASLALAAYSASENVIKRKCDKVEKMTRLHGRGFQVSAHTTGAT